MWLVVEFVAIQLIKSEFLYFFTFGQGKPRVNNFFMFPFSWIFLFASWKKEAVNIEDSMMSVVSGGVIDLTVPSN